MLTLMTAGRLIATPFDVALIAAPVVYVDGSWLIRLQSAAEAQRQWALADAALHEVDSRMSLASGCAP